jgi:hypothetical protein
MPGVLPGRAQVDIFDDFVDRASGRNARSGDDQGNVDVGDPEIFFYVYGLRRIEPGWFG